MARPVSPTLPDEGLLVGWSLEGAPRKPLIGFMHNEQEGVGSQFLEPILHTGEGHLITVAPTGAGKGVGCIIPALLRYRGPVVVIDPKGENYAVTSRARREMGQRVIALDPFASRARRSTRSTASIRSISCRPTTRPSSRTRR